jgi:Flp pilus assembly pilin Flp
MRRIIELARDRRAVTSLEYAVIASALGLALISMFGGLGAVLATVFTNIGASI